MQPVPPKALTLVLPGRIVQRGTSTELQLDKEGCYSRLWASLNLNLKEDAAAEPPTASSAEVTSDDVASDANPPAPPAKQEAEFHLAARHGKGKLVAVEACDIGAVPLS